MNLFKEGQDLGTVTDLERQGDTLTFFVLRHLATTAGPFELTDATDERISICIDHVIQKTGMDSLRVTAHVV
jgi:hypothetical protein